MYCNYYNNGKENREGGKLFKRTISTLYRQTVDLWNLWVSLNVCISLEKIT